MKKIRFNLALFVLALVLLSSCGGLNRMRNNADDIRYDVTPEVLEAHGSEVEVTIRGTFPDRYFHRNAILEINPVITWNGGEEALGSITLQGENVTANHQVIPRGGGSFTHTDRVPFRDDMRISDLVVRLNAELRGNEAEFDPRKIADGVIATSTLVVHDPEAVKVGDKFQRVVPETIESAIFYVINRANVRQSELRSERMENFRQYLRSAVEDDRTEVKAAGINAYASPDGPIDFNERLSEQRKETSDRVFDSELKRAGIEQRNNFYNTRALGEDWEGFRKLMEESDIDQRGLILRVLEMYQDPEVREREIRNISAVFTEIADKVLPELRRSEMAIDVERIGYSDQELREVYREDPSRLNLEEMLYTATLYDDLNTRYQIYNRTAQRFPDCFRAHNSKGIVLMKLDNVAAAKSAFQDAQAISNNDAVRNNLGAVALREGNIEEAEEYFASVSTPGDATNYNMGIVAIHQADYSKASSLFGNMAVVNNALVKMLQDNDDQALRILNNIDDPGAKAYYLRAVIGARKQDSNMLFDNLRTAVNMDAELKEYAETDMEFGRYFQDDTFISIVN